MKKISFIAVIVCLFMISCSGETGDKITNQFAEKLLILQVYASTDNAGGASHSFIELYNITNEAVSLNGVSLLLLCPLDKIYTRFQRKRAPKGGIEGISRISTQ